MILRKAIAITLIGLVVTSTPAMAGTLDDRYGVLDRQAAIEMNQVIQKADANGLDLGVFILKNQDLSGSTLDNWDVEQAGKALLDKRYRKDRKKFVVVVVSDRATANGESPVIRWFAKDNIGVTGSTFDNLFANLKAQRDRGQWQIGLVEFFNSVTDTVIAINNFYFWLIVVIIVFAVLILIFGKSSGTGSGDSDYFFDGDSGGSGGDLSGGD